MAVRAKQCGANADQLATAATFSRLDIFKRDDWTCGICRQEIDPEVRYPEPGSPSLDHIIPTSQGGLHVPENVRASHLVCNVARNDSAAPEWLVERIAA